ncbi:Hypothetical predicted protein [Paramuricea clavata]|uniref:Uncharacterized protein n=1 Tax=Paramuricea clavata TaxID=317549 RepID=A0A6S7IN99_PARCT|nr:Hypothetical predicted protein [Paramuricea clavata]
MIKEQFGQPSVIARALVSNVTKGGKIGRSDTKKLREFSIDLINCMATMKRIGYTADINANENLRKIITRLPNHMIERWKVFVVDIREKVQTPAVSHISEYVRKRVKAEFDPDFGDLQRDSRPPRSDHPTPRRGIYAAGRDSNRSPMKCYVCEEEHRVIECPVLAKASVPERLELAKKARLSRIEWEKRTDRFSGSRRREIRVQAVNCPCPKSNLSLDEKRAMELMERSWKLDDNRYVIGRPWKRDKNLLSDNRSLAETRLRSLEKSLSKNDVKARMYDQALMQYAENNWAIPVSEEDLKVDRKPFYYLPHHGVYRPDKKSTPLQVVFDPATSYLGMSLNSFLFKGPGLIGNLLGVLLHFREEQVAFSGDISKMLLQILLLEEDTHVHHFLWQNLDATREPTTYALQRAMFGDKPSTDMASFVMLKMAEANEKECPRAATILKRDRYVDDLIHSCPSTDDAVKSIEEVDKLLSTRSFKIREWLCFSTVQKANESEQLKVANGSENNSHPVTPIVNLDGEEENKTLGVIWNPKRDVIGFASKEVKVERLTRRSVLSNISKLYDPLGLASAVTIKARIALQNIWKAKQFDWDDTLPEVMSDTWKKLFKEIESLKKVEFPRCQPKETSENPAYDLSRGITVEELSSGRWINGPSFLSKPKTEWPCERKTEPDVRSEVRKKKKSPNSLAAIVKPQPLLNPEHFSDWDRLVRVTAYCQRFVKNTKYTT